MCKMGHAQTPLCRSPLSVVPSERDGDPAGFEADGN